MQDLEAAASTEVAVAVRSPRLPLWWPLGAVLVVQAAVSASLIWSNTAFTDEAAYLFVGHVELNHWFHGAPIPASADFFLPFASTLSGAPQLYPPLAAVADTVGHLAAARLLSLVFMLAATVLLYRTTSLLYGRSGAIAAAVVWMTTITTLHVGAFATYDAPSITLLSVAAWTMVESLSRERRWIWLSVSGGMLALTALVAYSYTIYLPAIWVLCYFFGKWRDSSRSSFRATLCLSGVTIAVLAVLGTLLGVWSGMFHQTVARGSRDLVPWNAILDSIWNYIGLVFLIVLAAGIVAILRAGSRFEQIVVALLVATVLLVPAYQLLVVRTNWSLEKHVACGIWLGSTCVAAGVSHLPTEGWLRRARAVAGTTLGAYLLVAGWLGAFSVQQGWANTSKLVSVMRRLDSSLRGRAMSSIARGILPYYSLPASDSGAQVNWGAPVPLDPPVPKIAWPSYYETMVAKERPSIVILTFSGQAPPRSSAPGVLGRDPDASSGGGSGSVAFAQVLDSEPNYQVTAVGPYNQGWGTAGRAGFFVVWQRA